MGLAEVIMKHTELGMKTQMLEVKVEHGFANSRSVNLLLGRGASSCRGRWLPGENRASELCLIGDVNRSPCAPFKAPAACCPESRRSLARSSRSLAKLLEVALPAGQASQGRLLSMRSPAGPRTTGRGAGRLARMNIVPFIFAKANSSSSEGWLAAVSLHLP